METSMKQSKDKHSAMVKADRYFSAFIRARDSNKGVAVCCSCGKSTSTFDCGHFMSRRFQATRYDELNANAQCLRCNRFENGNQFEHARYIDAKHGAGTAEALRQKARMTSKRTQNDYEWIARTYKDKLDALGVALKDA